MSSSTGQPDFNFREFQHRNEIPREYDTAAVRHQRTETKYTV